MVLRLYQAAAQPYMRGEFPKTFVVTYGFALPHVWAALFLATAGPKSEVWRREWKCDASFSIPARLAAARTTSQRTFGDMPRPDPAG